MSDEKHFRISDPTVLRDEDCIAFHKDTGCVSRLNESGYTTLLHFIEPQTIKCVSRSIAQIFNISLDTAYNDVTELVGELTKQEFLIEIKT